jgi:hypothetical protein
MLTARKRRTLSFRRLYRYRRGPFFRTNRRQPARQGNRRKHAIRRIPHTPLPFRLTDHDRPGLNGRRPRGSQIPDVSGANVGLQPVSMALPSFTSKHCPFDVPRRTCPASLEVDARNHLPAPAPSSPDTCTSDENLSPERIVTGTPFVFHVAFMQTSRPDPRRRGPEIPPPNVSLRQKRRFAECDIPGASHDRKDHLYPNPPC